MSKSEQLRIFVPINKIDEEQRLVYGTVAAEVLDNSGEMFDYEGSKPYFEKWSANAHATSGGKSKGNLRVMHTSKVAGVVSDLGFDDDARIIEACAKVIDDDEWKMVKAGGYTGFSMGGRYVSRATKSDGVKTYVADPVEISLVDKPCIPTATFSVVKADGTETVCRFQDDLYLSEGDLEKVANKEPYGDVKYADPGYQKDKKKRYPIDTADHIRAAWSYINKEANAGQYSSKQLSDIKGRIVAAWKKTIDKDGPPSAEKSDAGEMAMKTQYIPTNDEVLPVARELAKADGQSEEAWPDFMDAARTKLIDEHIAKADGPMHADEDCKVENCEKCAEMKAAKADGPPQDIKDKIDAKKKKDGGEDNDDAGDTDEDKGDAEKVDNSDASDEDGTTGDDAGEGDAEKSDVPDLRQFWFCSDGEKFEKKSDAKAHERDLLAKKDEVKEPSIVDQLSNLAKTAEAIAKGEEIPEEPVAEQSELGKFSTLFESVIAKAEGNEILQKSMYTVERMARLLRDAASLQIAISTEQKKEGDDSMTPGMVGVAIGQLGDTLIAMAKEEVEELMLRVASDKPLGSVDNCPAVAAYDDYMELAAPILGLEKSVLTERITDKLEKRIVDAGEDAGTLAKLDEANRRADEAVTKADKLQGEMDQITPLVKSLQDQIDVIKKLPLPKAPTTIIGKGDGGNNRDVKGAEDDLLTKYTPDQIADAAIRMSHRSGGRHFVNPGQLTE